MMITERTNQSVLKVPLKLLVASLGATVFLSGCALERINSTMAENEVNLQRAERHIRDLQHRKDTVRSSSALRKMDNLWVDTTPLPMNNKSLGAVPTALDCKITFNPKSAVSLSEFARIVTNLCGVAVNVSSDAIQALTTGIGSGIGSSSGRNRMDVNDDALPPPTIDPSFMGGGGGSVNPSGGSTFFASMDGNSISGIVWNDRPLAGLLDLVTSRLGLGWKYQDDAVYIFYTDTQTYHLYAIPGKTLMGTKVKSGSSSSSGSRGEQSGSFDADGSEQSTEIDFETNIIDDIRDTLENMVTPGLGRITVSGSTGTVTVTDRPDVLARVKSYIDRENKRITRQVLLNVKVISVSVDNHDGMGLDWNAVYERMGNYSITFGGSGIGILGQSGLNAGASINRGRWDGTTQLIDALSSQGRVSTLISPSVTTTNLKPAPVLVGKQTSYLAEVSTTTTSGDSTGGNSQQSLIPGTVTTGFNMTLLPYLMEGPEMLLQYSINLSDLQDIKRFESGDQSIELPVVDNRIFSQSVKLRSGETLVLSGFDQAVSSSGKQGVGDPGFWLLGGRGEATSNRNVIVVLITPIILD